MNYLRLQVSVEHRDMKEISYISVNKSQQLYIYHSRITITKRIHIRYKTLRHNQKNMTKNKTKKMRI